MPKPSTKRLKDLQEGSVEGEAKRQPTLILIARNADEAPPWWSPYRDAYLREFFPTESYLAGAIYSVCSRNASYAITFKGPERGVREAYQLLHTANMFGGWLKFSLQVSLDLYCLAGKTHIHLGGERRGMTKSIAKIVKEKDPGPVLSTDSDGHIVERPITEWHKTPLGGRRWWWISLDKASHHGRDKRGGISITEDHPVLTESGWLFARDVKEGMMVATGDPAPSDEQLEVIVGGLLGDMNITTIRKRSVMRFSHSVKQIGWLDFKLGVLDGFQWTGRSCHEGKYGNPFIGVNSRGSLALTSIRGAWYPNGKKIVNREMVEKYFSPRMMAVWYCDDGSFQRNYTRAGNETTPHGYLATNGFSEDDVQWLTNFLNEKGFPCSLYMIPNKIQGKKYPVIYLSSEAMRRLVQFIGAYIPDPMRYKLPDDAPSFDPSLWDIEPAKVFFDKVIASKPKDYKSGVGVVQTTYHIGVEETGNFIAANTVVHNSQDNGSFFEAIRPARVRVKGLSGEPRAVKMMDDGEAVWAAVGWKGGKREYIPLRGIEYTLKDNPIDLPIGVNHLDAARCQRTNDPEYPVIYTDDDGFPHKMSWYQVMTIEDLPSASRDMNSVGWCATSRALKLAQTLRDMTVLKQEKASGRFAGRIYLTNVDADVIQDAVDMSKDHANNLNLTRYMSPIIAYTMEPNATPAVATLDMASLPEGFNEEEAMRWYIAGLAIGFGVDYGFLAPLPGNKLGTSQQAEVAERQSRGKASRLYMSQMAEIFNYKGLLPRSVWMEFEETDYADEMQRDMAAARRAQTRSERIGCGEITPQVARQIAVDQGDLDSAYLEMMSEEDVTPGGYYQPEVAGGMNPSLGYGKVAADVALDTGQEPTEEKSWTGVDLEA